jgi:sialic acid synthase SpsE
MRIGNLDLDERVLIVAEIGNNHEGSFALAQELISLAAEAGADAVKFQTFRAEHYVTPADRSRFERLRSFELTIEQFERLSEMAAAAGVLFISTPFDLESARGLGRFADAIKIASGDNTFYPLLETAAATGKPLIVSTGLADLRQIDLARATIERAWSDRGVRQDLALLHCVSSYPVPVEQANLGAIGSLRAVFDCTVGYSDHTLGIDAATIAVAAGARIVEKHFTIAKDHSEFRDHQLSADPSDLKELVRRTRSIERMMGSGDPSPRPCERDMPLLVRRSIAAARDLPAGSVLSREVITWVRPGGGFAPGEEDLVLGRALAAPLAAGRAITPEVLVPETAAV